jgi:hypothetical protein
MSARSGLRFPSSMSPATRHTRPASRGGLLEAVQPAEASRPSCGLVEHEEARGDDAAGSGQQRVSLDQGRFGRRHQHAAPLFQKRCRGEFLRRGRCTGDVPVKERQRALQAHGLIDGQVSSSLRGLMFTSSLASGPRPGSGLALDRSHHGMTISPDSRSGGIPPPRGDPLRSEAGRDPGGRRGRGCGAGEGRQARRPRRR